MSAGPDHEGREALRDFEALDLLATMVAIVHPDGACLVANAALEGAIGLPRRTLVRGNVLDWFADPVPLADALRRVAHEALAGSRFEALLRRHPPGTHELPVHVIVSPVDRGEGGGGRADARVLVEMIEIEQQTRLDREERAHGLVQAHRDLVRNLAHEIKNPLGGIRGAAQLLAMEIDSRALAEYTDVIIREADRLQSLVDRLLAPQRGAPVVSDVNIHEVCERVRSLVLAEFPRGLEIRRDYDASLPEFRGDREQMMQAVLNIVRNAAEALGARIAAGDARIVLRTRVARQVTLGRQRHRLALVLHVEDNGPGVPDSLRDRIFQPLVSGREGGSGLGLTLAQTFVQQHGGTIACDSAPGRTTFDVLIPLP